MSHSKYLEENSVRIIWKFQTQQQLQHFQKNHHFKTVLKNSFIQFIGDLQRNVLKNSVLLTAIQPEIT